MSFPSNLEEARATLTEWKTQRKTSHQPRTDWIVYKTSFEFEYYREAVLYRIIELAEATIILLDGGNYLGAVTIARSLRETMAVMWYMHEECAKAVESKNLKSFTTTMNKLMVGFKVDDEELFPDPVLSIRVVPNAVIAWLPESLAFNGLFQWPRFARLVRVFPPEALSWLHGELVSRLQKASRRERSRWHGFRLLAADKTTLPLHEFRLLREWFGAHKGSRGLGRSLSNFAACLTLSHAPPCASPMARCALGT
jgi:hypothetical protein